MISYLFFLVFFGFLTLGYHNIYMYQIYVYIYLTLERQKFALDGSTYVWIVFSSKHYGTM